MLGFSCTMMITWEGILVCVSPKTFRNLSWNPAQTVSYRVSKVGRPWELPVFGLRNLHTSQWRASWTGIRLFGCLCWYIISVYYVGRTGLYVCTPPLHCIFFEADKWSSARAPTSGGQYHWVAMLAPRSCRNFLSYITGTRRIASYWAAPWPDSPHIRMAHRRRLASSRRIRGIPLRNTDPSINYIKPPIIWLSGMACNFNLLGGFGRGCLSKYGHQQRATEDRRIDFDLAYLGILCCFDSFGVYVSVKGIRQGCVHFVLKPGWMELSRTIVFHWAHGLGFFVSWYFLPGPYPEHCLGLFWLIYKSKVATASFMCVTKSLNQILFSL